MGGLELRGINGKKVRGHAALAVFSHVCDSRPITLRFVNVYGDLEVGKDGLLRVTISARVPLGVSFDEGSDGVVRLAAVCLKTLRQGIRAGSASTLRRTATSRGTPNV